MACEGGIGALLDEAIFHENGTFPEEISAIDGFHAKAMMSGWVVMVSRRLIGMGYVLKRTDKCC